MRPALLAASLLAALALAAPAAYAQDAATRLARDAVIVDTHIDAPGILMDTWADLGVEAKDREFDYPKARAGGLGDRRVAGLAGFRTGLAVPGHPHQDDALVPVV